MTKKPKKAKKPIKTRPSRVSGQDKASAETITVRVEDQLRREIVALNREFSIWNEKDPSAVDWRLYMGVSRSSLDWPKLLEKHRVVILAEAGSGKSAELEDRARLQAIDGKYSFYATVQDVARQGLAGAMSIAHQAQLDAWKASDKPAWFFIDSVDEAKLDNIRLGTALRQLSDGIEGARSRAYIILSGRHTDWEFRTDLARLNAILPVPVERPAPTVPTPDTILVQTLRGERPKKTEEKSEQPLVVVMAPLDANRVRLFAAGKGVKRLDEFMAEIEAANLWSLASRPLDLQWLVAYWQQNGRFGSFAAMLESSLNERLREPNPQHARTDEISLNRAMHALERIGAAFVFGRTDKLIIPDSEIMMASLSSDFDLAKILPDWSSNHRGKLLTRAVFDPSTFGRVRLHNDNEGIVRSYLAARWLQHRKKQPNFSVRTLMDLLFATTYGVSLIKPSLRETATWLAIWDSEIAQEIIARDPDLLLTGGDPGSLSLASRRAALARVVSRMVSTNEKLKAYDHSSLQRFSTPDIVPQIRVLWDHHKNHAEVRQLLLMMIWLGRLSACADIASEAVFGNFGDNYTSIFGGRALVSTADAPTLARYADRVKARAASLPSNIFWEALDQLFLCGITIADFLTILRNMDEKTRDEGLGFKYYGPRIIERLMVRADLEHLLTGLLEQLGNATGDYAHEETPIEKAYYPSIAATAHVLMKLVSANEAPLVAVDAALRLSEGRRYRSSNEDMAAIRVDLHQTPARRRIAFWRAVAQYNGHRMLMGRGIHNCMQLDIIGWTPGLRPEDIEWLLEDALTRHSDDERLLVINTAMEIWRDSGKSNAVLSRIEGVAKSHPVMLDLFNAWLNPPTRSPEDIESFRQMEEMRSRHADEEAARNRSWVNFLKPLRADPDQLRRLPAPTPENVDGRLYHLWQLLQSTADQDSRYAIDDVTPLKAILGPELTAATRDALIHFWRQWKPTLESSRPPDKRNIISTIDCMGIAGVSIDAKVTENWAAQLTSADATLAALYATLELNGFPSWFPGLAAAWPDEVCAVLMHEIIAEIDSPASGPRISALQDIAYAPPEIARVVAPALVTEVKNRSTIPVQVLSSVLDVISRGLVENADTFSAMALDRFSQSTDADTAALYLVSVFKIDAAAATAALSLKLDTLNASDQSRLAQRVLPHMFGDRLFRQGVDPQLLTFDVLERLVHIAFQTIRIEDDNHRESGVVYSPDERDAAESARSAVFNQLVNTPGRATFEALRRLADIQGFPIPPERLQLLAINRAVTDSEHSPWPASEAHQLEHEFDTAPSTPADLQGVAMRRVSDIQHDLHHADFAQGLTVKSLPNEREVQKWTASELRSRQGRAYSVEREPHVADEKEPDIRLRSKATDASLPIEIKVAESWTLTQLEDALTTQLGARYLRAQDAKHGVLLLVHKQSRPRGWKDASGKVLTFTELVAHLQNIADDNAARAPDAPQATIAVLDVSGVVTPATKPRLRPRGKGKARRTKTKRSKHGGSTKAH